MSFVTDYIPSTVVCATRQMLLEAMILEANILSYYPKCLTLSIDYKHSYDILGARMLWKPKEARILKNF
jgi:hypothetical protein